MSTLPPRPTALRLDGSLQFLPGVGPRRFVHLSRLGLNCVDDLVRYFPFRHERHEHTTIADLTGECVATIVGKVTAFRPRAYHRGPSAMATLADNTGRCSVTWFNAPYVLDRVRRGAILRLTGRVRDFKGLPQFINPQFELLPPDAAPLRTGQFAALEPIYYGTKELAGRVIGRLIERVLPQAVPLVEETLPDGLRMTRRLDPRGESIRTMHRPESEQALTRARRRLAYEELLTVQLAVGMARRRRDAIARTAPLRRTEEIDQRIRRRLPFTLTAAQDRAIAEICADMNRPRPMTRLLQGDVGCGKTVVAAYAALVAVACRRQAALLAPTELLAEQHFATLSRLLAGSRVKLALWTGAAGRAQRAVLRRDAAEGALQIAVGTQALLEPDVEFARLGLVIVDEQHRLGVRQRAVLRNKGGSPHYLVISATPIPRSLAMTLFGDLDVSVIDGLPPGREVIQTRVLAPPDFDHAWRFIRDRVGHGEQAYVVHPLVEESPRAPLRAATAEAERLAVRELKGLRIEVLHGRMKPADKEAVMRRFAAGGVDVLAATTVIEVGIDVPNATVMAIQHADRYGLAQLHQLRGRVGRGGRRGYCYLMSDALDAAERRRLAVLTQTTDGFRIAEEDLRLRGPGELLGALQHGVPAFRVADLLRDEAIIRETRGDAAAILDKDPMLRERPWAALRRMVMKTFGGRLAFLEAG